MEDRVRTYHKTKNWMKKMTKDRKSCRRKKENGNDWEISRMWIRSSGLGP